MNGVMLLHYRFSYVSLNMMGSTIKTPLSPSWCGTEAFIYLFWNRMTNGGATDRFNTGKGIAPNHFFICHIYGLLSGLNYSLEPQKNQASRFIYRYSH